MYRLALFLCKPILYWPIPSLSLSLSLSLYSNLSNVAGNCCEKMVGGGRPNKSTHKLTHAHTHKHIHPHTHAYTQKTHRHTHTRHSHSQTHSKNHFYPHYNEFVLTNRALSRFYQMGFMRMAAHCSRKPLFCHLQPQVASFCALEPTLQSQTIKALN